MTNRSDETTADKAARHGMTPDEYRAHRHLAAVRQIRAALPGLYATTGLRVEAALTEPAAVSAVVEPPAGQTTPSHRAGLRDLLAQALATADGWDIPTGATLRDVSEELATHFRGPADAVLAVLYREWPWLRAEAEDAPPTDRDALRQRIAQALEEADYRPDMRRGDLADAIMPVLPAPADRAAVLREAADRIDREDLPQDDVDMFDNGARWATKLLRRMADETATTQTPPERVKHSGPDSKFCVLCLSGEHERVDDEPAAGARQADETATTEAPWPTVTDFSLEVWEGDTWVGVTFKRKTLDEARERRESFRRRFPEAQLRIVRWDETSTVVEADPGPAAGARQDGGRP